MGYAVSSFHLGSDSSSFSEMETSSTRSSSRSVYPSGLDDLAISFDAYKKRSSPDVVNRFQSMELYNDLSEGVGPSGAAESNEIGKWVRQLKRFFEHFGRPSETVKRPPLLKPPPAMKKSPIDLEGSSWDFLEHLGPASETVKRSSSSFSSSCNGYDEEEAREVETEESFIQLGDEADEMCSFFTNEGDSSSTVSIIASWQKGQQLGRGSFGFVYEGISADGDFFAVKEVSLLAQGSQAQECIQQLEGEIAVLSQLQHQNIVRYRGTAKDESNLYIFLELVTQGSLLMLYRRYQLMDSQVSLYTRQILDGLNYLHEKGFIHRDIKCANILVDASGVVKLADIELVSTFNDLKLCKGTSFWMAPEVISLKGGDEYGNQVDIWSLGCTVLEMLTRQIPYSHLEPSRALFQIGKGILPPLPETLSPDARDFILKCLIVNPQERPTAAELLNHPFVRRPFTSPGSGSILGLKSQTP